MATLVVADYAVIVVTMLISSGIGVYYWLAGGRQKSTEVSVRLDIPAFQGAPVLGDAAPATPRNFAIARRRNISWRTDR